MRRDVSVCVCVSRVCRVDQGELFASYFAVNNMTPKTIFVGAKRFPVQTICAHAPQEH